ncbi:uncharacterized protein BJ171DRAFT_296326 [Polychytrium aggregatum]|uniref:uncharacterized protein n=1 Tax=Polychytrium aggregatum TaxID=110093 RepID=UPI0022FDF1CD|nr:uncharacterized protein BJ171DRAFT_296326 [Polychytrium aggregatum]KAI9207373.1 hypothetical protein BJ171DRAFT_296326 [Polychytrium aggregatum]
MSTRAAKRQRLHEQLVSLGIEETFSVLLAVLSVPELIEMLTVCSLVKLKATSSDVRTLFSTKTVGIRIWAEWFDKQYDTRLLPEDCVQMVKYFPAGPFPSTSSGSRPYRDPWFQPSSSESSLVSAKRTPNFRSCSDSSRLSTSPLRCGLSSA